MIMPDNSALKLLTIEDSGSVADTDPGVFSSIYNADINMAANPQSADAGLCGVADKKSACFSDITGRHAGGRNSALALRPPAEPSGETRIDCRYFPAVRNVFGVV